MKFFFPFLCWAVPALGVFIACAPKPKACPDPNEPMIILEEK